MTMMVNSLKYIVLILLIFIFFVFCFQNVSGQQAGVSPPDIEQARRTWDEWNRENVIDRVRSIFQNIIGERFSFLVYFFENITQKIENWWFFSARLWILEQWNYLIDYLNQKIKIGQT